MTRTERLLSLEGLSHRYSRNRRSVHALDDISFDVRDGEFIVLVGASGCGKSTLLKLIAGLMPPTAGSIARGPKLSSANSVGMVFQRPVLMPWRSVLRNVLLPTEILGGSPSAKQDAMRLIEHTGLAGFEQSYPHELSGGMQQRVAICRALLPNPPLLLMDEPFGALDAITRERLNMMLQRIWAETGKTIILVTHNIEEAVFLADRIVVMSPRPGRITEIIDNDLERPRGMQSFKSPLFAELGVHIRSLIVGEGEADDVEEQG